MVPDRAVNLVVHADWSAALAKRWQARATRQADGAYLVSVPEQAGELAAFLPRLSSQAGPAGVAVIGFDFPIGLPLTYAERAGVENFLDALPHFGNGRWADFYHPAARPEEISLQRPFYPQRPGAARRQHLLDGLGILEFDELRRTCERAHPGRQPAAPLFWTLGGQQVGKAAISGWRDLLAPGLLNPDLNLQIWPFHGDFESLLQPGTLVAVETYPGEIYAHLGITFRVTRTGRRSGKRDSVARAANAPRLSTWARGCGVEFTPALQAALHAGFGRSSSGEDQFDALVGLLGMLNVLLGYRAPGNPTTTALRRVEGWILGQDIHSARLEAD